jgi:hypothetical protein
LLFIHRRKREDEAMALMNTKTFFVRMGRWWPGGLVVLHIVKNALWFRHVDFSSGLPIFNVDYVQYYARVVRAHIFLTRSGRFWGYDPFEGAGAISGPFLDVGTYLMSLVAHSLARWIPLGQTVLWFETAGLFLVPFTLYLALRNFSASREQSWLGFGVTLLMFGFMDNLSHVHVPIGLFGYMVACYLVFWQVSLLWKWTENKTALSWAGFTVLSILVPQVHAASLLVAVVPCLCILVVKRRFLKLADALLISLSLLLVFAFNWYWIHPYLAFRDWMGWAPYFVTEGIFGLGRFYLPLIPKPFFYFRAFLCWMLTAAAIAALRKLLRSSPAQFAVFTVWLGWLLIIFCFGSHLPVLRGIQPGRNEFPFWLIIQFLAAFSIQELMAAEPVRRRIFVSVFTLTAGLMLADAAGMRMGEIDLPDFTNRLTEGQSEFVHYLKTKGPFPGRMLLEGNDRLEPNFADAIPMMTGQMLLGGPHPGNFMKTQFSTFKGFYIDGHGYHLSFWPRVFDRYLEHTDEDTFQSYLDMYNVTRVAAWSKMSISRLNRYARILEPVDTIGSRAVYRVIRPSSWFFKGSGEIEPDYDQITLRNASRGPIQIKFHWIETFRTDPPIPLHPVYVKDDPLPFIALDNSAGKKTIKIYNAGL